MIRISLRFACVMLLVSMAAAQRLPQTAVPEHYQLTLTPDFTQDNFGGQETIRVRVQQATTQIVLNSADIEIQEASIRSGSTTQNATTAFDKEKEMVALSVEKPIGPGVATIKINYTGTLNSEMRGFYLGKDDHGRKYAATQFESTDARRAFPCFDEPAYKATFDITLVADKGMVAIANTRELSDKPAGDKHTVHFANSAKMSSYLVAFAVGNFEYLEGSADGIPIRVYSVPGKKDLGAFALQASENFLHYFDSYFGIKYPYGKLDLIGLPDFSAGAMENIGLITFREVDLELNEKTASLTQKKAVAITVSHEIAHEWFGDLVTMQWWDDVWLNEGFATWMEAKPIEAWKPEWHTLLDEVSRGDILTTFGALNVDSLASTRPIHQAAETPGQILELFDGIAYGKAAAVLRMIEAYLGPETFRRGVVAYLKEHAYGTSTADDFSNTLAKVSGKPVDKIMPTFVHQAGVPIVTASAECVGGTTKVNLKQQRYYYNVDLLNAANDQLWQVPICVKSISADGKTTQQCELLTKREETFTVAGCPAAVLANGGGTGYYRAGYSSEAVQALARESETALTPLERIVLLADVWASVRVGREPVGDYLALADGVKSDRTSAVLTAAFNQLKFIDRYLVTDQDRAAYQAWVRNSLSPLARQIGWIPTANEDEDYRSVHARLLNVLGTVGDDPEAKAEAGKLAEQAMRDPGSVNADLAGVAVAVTASDGDAAFYDRVMNAMKTAKTPGEFYQYFYTLPAFGDPQLIERTLRFAISPDVRSQDALGLIGAVMGSSAGQQVAWDFVRSHWAEVEKAGGPFAGAAIQGSAAGFCDAGMRDQAQEFFETHKSDAAARTSKQSIERINNCIAMKAAQSGQLQSWLASQSPDSSTSSGSSAR